MHYHIESLIWDINIKDLESRCVHVHLTLSEAISEAACEVEGNSIYML